MTYHAEFCDAPESHGSPVSRESFASGKLTTWLLASLLSAFGWLGASTAHAQCMYRIEAELSPPPGALTLGVSAINDNNMIVGSFLTSSFTFRPYMWTAETGVVPIALPPGVLEAEPRDVNNNGEIVGRLTRPEVGGVRAFRYKDGAWTELPPTGSGIHSEAFGINDDGWVVGYRDTSEGRKAFRWLADVVEELDSPIGGGAVAIAVNDSANVTGGFGTLAVGGLGFLWDQRQATTIQPIKGTSSSEGRAINGADVVTGWARPKFMGGPIPTRSWVFDHGELLDLGEFKGNIRTRSNDMNDASQIVGVSATGTETNNIPFLWQHGQMFDLRTLVADAPGDLFLRGAAAINQSGKIAVEDSGVLRWLILAPIDRPLGDVNIDCVVDEHDLIAVLEDWGPDKLGHLTDMVSSATFQPPGDGKVDAADLAIVLGNWSISTEAPASKRRR